SAGFTLLDLAGTIMTCRMVGSGVVVNTIGISAIKLLHAVELSLLLVAVFKYIAKNFDNRLASVMYLVGYQLSNQLGAAIPCCAMLSHLISCYSVLSHAMLCYGILLIGSTAYLLMLL
ncbi:MAG: MFS transporter, partial [Selenomonadaceae bacterium]|nr:MFS transporter [Selenomonadaceae bacterium]